MRRANQPDPSTNGQFRMVGDHLGSTTLVLDTSSPQVIHRQYYKPHGEVATQSGSSRTSIGYTGQRLDQDSGLMFYGARFYDPVLSYFVSADTIAPGKGNPKSRHRYAYVLSNPVKHLDPDGHTAVASNDPLDDPVGTGNTPAGDCNTDKAEECKAYKQDLASYGYDVIYLGSWTASELFLMLSALQDLCRRAGWSISDFKRNFNITEDQTTRIAVYRVHEYKVNGINPAGAALHNGTQYNRKLIITDGAHHAGDNDFKVVVVHESAHLWDAGTGLKRRAGLANYVGGEARTSEHANVSTGEDWAESVAAMVYPDSTRYNLENTPGPTGLGYANRMGPRHIMYVLAAFIGATPDLERLGTR